MIRDPSDGSVREKPDVGIPISKPIADSSPVMTSGLPITTDPREIERLNRSREWLKQRNEGMGK